MPGIFGNLVFLVLLGTSFIYSVTKGISPAERRLVTFNSSPMSILTVEEAEPDKTAEQQNDTLTPIMAEKNCNQQLVRLVLSVALNPLSETSALVGTNAKDVVQIDVLTQFEQKLPGERCT